MRIVCELPYIKSFGLVSVNEILSHTFFKKNSTTKHKSILFCWFLKREISSPLSQCAAFTQASSFWPNFSRDESMELKNTKFAWVVGFQPLKTGKQT